MSLTILRTFLQSIGCIMFAFMVIGLLCHFAGNWVSDAILSEEEE